MCGTSFVGEARQQREVRKVVTILFADVAGYTRAGEQLDPEALRSLQSRYFEALVRSDLLEEAALTQAAG